MINMTRTESRPAVPAGMIETAAGRVVADGGYGRLLAALDEAYEVNDHVGVTLLGDRGGVWAFVLGDHFERNGTVHVSGDTRIVIQPDSTDVVTGGNLVWHGGHSMPDGARTERFTLDGVALTITWTDATAQAEAANA